MKTIPLSKGYVAIVDDEDFALLAKHKWRARLNGRTVYAVREFRDNGKNRTQYMHRLILGIEGLRVDGDHVNHNGLDNRRINLRIASRAENRRNSQKMLSPTRSIYKGVSWVKRPKHRPWQAKITVLGKRVYLGYFSTQEEAALAYRVAAEKHYGEFACY